MQKLFYLFTTLFAVTMLTTNLHAFILDNSNLPQAPRTYCGTKTNVDMTPLQQSIEQGECESFAKPVGRIFNVTSSGNKDDTKVFFGVGTLISNKTIIASAHVVEGCDQKDKICAFVLKGKWPGQDELTRFKDIYYPPQYEEKIKNKARLIELKNNNKVIAFEEVKSALSFKRFMDSKIQKKLDELKKTVADKELINEQIPAELTAEVEKYSGFLERSTAIVAADEKRLADLRTPEVIERDELEVAINTEGDFNDVAIVSLQHTPINFAGQLGVNFNPIVGNNQIQKFFGVTNNLLIDNATGNPVDRNGVRHIGIFSISYMVDNFLGAIYTTPADYDGLSYLDSLAKPLTFAKRFVYDPQTFLMAALVAVPS